MSIFSEPEPKLICASDGRNDLEAIRAKGTNFMRPLEVGLPSVDELLIFTGENHVTLFSITVQCFK